MSRRTRGAPRSSSLAALALLPALGACAAAVPPVASRPEAPPDLIALEHAAEAARPTDPAVAEHQLMEAIDLVGHAPPDAGRGRTRISPHAFRVADLPIAEIPEPLPSSSAPGELPPGESPADLVIAPVPTASGGGGLGATLTAQAAGDPRFVASLARGQQAVRVTLAGRLLGRIRIDGSEGIVGIRGAAGVLALCGGTPRSRIVPARWETVGPTGKGAVRYTVVNAWLDLTECRAVTVTRATVEAVPVAGTVLYAFQRRCAACDPLETVTFLGPRATRASVSALGGEATTQIDAFSRITLPIRRGGGASLLARVGAVPLAAWDEVSGSPSHFERELLVGVEIVQSVADLEPLAIAYLDATAEGGPSSPH